MLKAEPGQSPHLARQCPACMGRNASGFFDAGELPLNVGVFYDSRKSALQAPTGHLHLAYCGDCGFVFNMEHDPSIRIFHPGYEVALHHSETFRNFIAGVADRLIEQYDLRNKRILEIGCGDGYFLRLLAVRGGNECIGIDPTVACDGEQKVENGKLRLIRDYFGSEYDSIDAEFICSLSVFEDIAQPAPFLQTLHTIASRNQAPVYFEVFNAERAFDAREVWSVHYEQCNYFGATNLKSVLEHHGFSVKRAGHCYQDDQYVFVEAVPADRPGLASVVERRTELPLSLAKLGEHFLERRDLWNRRLAEYREKGVKVLLWGSGGKGITFLNAVKNSAAIEFVAEINPDKHGKFMPGTGQKIVPPEFIAKYQPDKIIITNALYESEMRQQAKALGVEPEFLIA